LPDARRILALADDAKRRLQRAAARSTPVRLGYVSWLPEDLTTLVGSAADLRLDEWVLPSHAQAERVAEGTLDVALAWVTADQVSQLGLVAHLVRTEALRAVLPGTSSADPVAAQRLSVLVDADESAWSSWNRYATEFAAAVGARVVHIDDGGITGDAFYAHVRKVGAAVLASPKRHTAALPPSLGQRPVAEPIPLWTWSLLHRRDDDRASVRDAVDALLTIARTRDWPAPPAGRWWAPAGDPHLR
ncbi:LysR family transcriptional regulator, partial [Mycobacterium sp. E3298]